MMDLAVAAIRLLPPEPAHKLTVELAARFGPFLPGPGRDDPRLAVNALGLSFPNPFGIAAGFDKNARAFRFMLKMGMGFAECGTVTPRPQPGNPKPRMYRLPQDGAVINRMGFDNDGMAVVAERLKRRGKGIVGINIGANKDSADRIADYRLGFQTLSALADYVTVNISSPNTPGLRGLQNREELHRLLGVLVEARGAAKIPLLLKIAPDLDEAALDDIAAEVLAAGLDGMIVTNTTIARPETLKSPHAGQTGGLSGKPLFVPSTYILREVRKRVGSKIVLIGVGGVSSGAEAYAKIRAGASLVQLYTSLVYHGAGLIPRLKRELLACLARDGFASVAEAVGADIPA
ncbi:dihydroorotate dehydrogenase [Rhizomicrobium palustre]|uniref:Dihydroorotate dehydrogenase (quinone) n=1 Tax=Rhizomicrobium palustre TaxID=189966 RepID=A0A846N0Y8_9PROT|nr:quinone-dependent dihydroorotate dehydrogenase [Rhizomicrobium palustre]NIK88827.1 dihydroorotate dehydrogenase [Rhizomicrobium palustre]